MTHTRDLTADQLVALVESLAGSPERWRHLVRHRADARTLRAAAPRRPRRDLADLLMNDHDTGFHDDDLSSGALSVVRGSVREERLVLGGAPEARVLSAGDLLSFGAADIHRVSHAGDEPAVTLHAYSPPLWRMGAYEIGDGGRLRRHSLSYAKELRPLAA